MPSEAKIAGLGLGVLVLMAVFEIGPIHLDEYFQLIEFAQYQLGNTPASDLPWEFHEKMRPTIQVWMVVGIIKTLNFVHIEDPFTIALILRLISCLGFWAVVLAFNQLLGARCFKDEAFSKMFQVSTYFIWFVPWANAHFSSESFSAIFLLLGLYPLIRDPHDKRGLLWAGLCLGLSFLFRYQTGIAAAGTYLWLLLVARVPVARIAGSSLVFVAVTAVGVIVDSAFYGEWVFAPFNYLKLNLVDGKASSFGTEPWYYYVTHFSFSRPLIGIPLVILFARGLVLRRNHLFTWVIVPFVVVHSLIAHKEMRFLFPMIYPFIFVAFHGFHSFFENREFPGYQRVLTRVFLGANLLVILLVMINPHETESNYRHLYRNIDKGGGTVIGIGQDCYEMSGLSVSFYRPDGVTSMVVDDRAGLRELLEENRIDAAFVIHDRYDMGPDLDGYSVERSHSIYPEWLVRWKGAEWRESLESSTVFLIRRKSPPQGGGA
ncbi:hypothetical protein [Haloferula sp. A504]|uniref:hypothetical protein n=1 Tax=Haloferula sp. A504 TaxID=3373601 RepID=UPI0031BF29EA|nr:hypothetical protein [Verrucomicrobiaceae bacterium E54]